MRTVALALALPVTVIALLVLPLTGSAQAGAAFIKGASDFAARQLERSLEEDRQRDILERQHKLETQRLEYEHRLRMEAIEREEQRRNQAEVEKRRAAQADQVRRGQEQVQAYHRQLEQQRQEAQKREEEERRAAEAEAQVEKKHPGWKKLVKTAQFKRWWDQQPASLQRLGDSQDPDDATLVFDLYKRERRLKQQNAEKK